MFPGTLSINAQNTLALLGKQKLFEKTYLAGGSSLALQLGHRYSIDFDFFIEEDFETSYYIQKLKEIGTYHGITETPVTIIGEFNKVKFSLFRYPYKLIANTHMYSGIRLADITDIVAMKLVAITDRGTKKDYVDLFFLANNCFSVEDMFRYYDKKYHNFDVNKITLLKALQYFIDADDSEMPKMISKVTWEQVKRFFEKETIRLAKKYFEESS